MSGAGSERVRGGKGREERESMGWAREPGDAQVDERGRVERLAVAEGESERGGVGGWVGGWVGGTQGRTRMQRQEANRRRRSRGGRKIGSWSRPGGGAGGGGEGAGRGENAEGICDDGEDARGRGDERPGEAAGGAGGHVQGARGDQHAVGVRDDGTGARGGDNEGAEGAGFPAGELGKCVGASANRKEALQRVFEWVAADSRLKNKAVCVHRTCRIRD